MCIDFEVSRTIFSAFLSYCTLLPLLCIENMLAHCFQDEVHTCHGENFQHAARKCWEMNPSQLVAVGVNCVSPKYVSSLLTGINKDRPHNPVPLIVYPNSGESYDREKG